MSNLVKHAERELALAIPHDDEYDGMIREAVLTIVRAFAEQGHSGMSAAITTAMIDKLLRFEPLTPLTGAEDEWVVLDYADHIRAQNKRCGRVFQRADGTAYDVEGKVFEDLDGSRWTNGDSHTEVTFPYTPKTEVVLRDE